MNINFPAEFLYYFSRADKDIKPKNDKSDRGGTVRIRKQTGDCSAPVRMERSMEFPHTCISNSKLTGLGL